MEGGSTRMTFVERIRPGRVAVVTGAVALAFAVTVPIALGRGEAGKPVTNYVTYVGVKSGAADPKLSPVVIGAVNTQGGQVLIGPGWTKGVQTAVEVFIHEARIRFDADRLAEGMDTGVGATGRCDAKGFLRETLPGGFDRALDRGLVGLKLPAGVCGAVVGYGQLEPARGHPMFNQRTCHREHRVEENLNGMNLQRSF